MRTAKIAMPVEPALDKKVQYIDCPRFKNRPRKHVLVCRNCRWGNRCRAYRAYLQPELPLVFAGRAQTAPSLPTDCVGKKEVV